MNQLRWCKDKQQHEHMLEMQRRNLEAAADNYSENWMNQKLSQTGHSWTRQAIWGYRLFDFWNANLGIAVEVDGPEHDRQYDAYRDEYNFRRSGIVVLRVKNRNEEDASRAIEFISNATFDGGCKGNPGQKYGSFAVFQGSQSKPTHLVGKVLKQEFGYGTNNEAEFEALLAGLKWTEDTLELGGFKLRDFFVSMVTDSTIVVGRINRSNRANKSEPQKRMFALTDKCLQSLLKFNGYSIAYVTRERNVELFGH